MPYPVKTGENFTLVFDLTNKSQPHRVRPVEYVKVCSLYGVGYYYIPGTDTCIKIGGYVRFEAYHNDVAGAYQDRSATSSRFTRSSNTFAMQARFRLTTDVRTQTEYGTLRSYVSFGLNWLNQDDDSALPGTGNFALALERAFIQFAGFTFGRSDTFFGFYNGAAYGLVPLLLDGSSGPSGHNVAAYTWQFGNGLSATISIEDAWGGRAKPIVDLSATGVTFAPVRDNSGTKVPDIVGNIRVDQAWGSAQVMGALHQVSARYYSGATPGFDGCVVGNLNTTVCDNPGDKWGWAVGGGLTLKMPWDARDTLSGVIAFSRGATGFVAYGNQNNFVHKDGVATSYNTDAVFVTGSGLELTEAWGGTLAFEHYWTPSLRTSIVGSYLNVSYTDQAKAMIATVGGLCGSVSGTPNCDPDYSIWRVASRTMWNPVQNLDIGVEVAYSQLDSAFQGRSNLVGLGGNLASGVYDVEKQGYWSAAFRVQRNFWP